LYLESYTPGKQLVGSTFTLALVTGQMIWDRMRSSFQRRSSGRQIYSRLEALEEREFRSRTYVGTATFETTSYNQEGRRRSRPSAPS
jgi:hypothetical protein